MPNGRKGGRPKNPALESFRVEHPRASERTAARYARGCRLIFEGISDEGAAESRIEELRRSCTRPNGSFNVTAFERAAEEIAATADRSEKMEDSDGNRDS